MRGVLLTITAPIAALCAFVPLVVAYEACGAAVDIRNESPETVMVVPLADDGRVLPQWIAPSAADSTLAPGQSIQIRYSGEGIDRLEAVAVRRAGGELRVLKSREAYVIRNPGALPMAPAATVNAVEAHRPPSSRARQVGALVALCFGSLALAAAWVFAFMRMR